MFGMSSTTTIGVVLLLLGAVFVIIAIIVSVQGVWTIQIDPQARKLSAILGGGLLVLGLIFALVDPVRGFAAPGNSPATSTQTLTPTPTPTLAPTSTPTPTPTPTIILITAPKDGNQVPIQTTVQGTASGIPDNEKLWVFILPDGTTAYHPQSENPVAVASDGKWSSNARFGVASEPRGLGFTVVVALADQQAQAAIEKYFKDAKATGDFKGFDPLPDGIRVITQIHVTRI